MTRLSVVRIILVGLLAVSIIYIIYDDHRAKLALKNHVVVLAKITGKGPTRQGTFIYVEYTYNGKKVESFFTIFKDTLRIGDTVLIEVSKNEPERYIKFVRGK